MKGEGACLMVNCSPGIWRQHEVPALESDLKEPTVPEGIGALGSDSFIVPRL